MSVCDRWSAVLALTSALSAARAMRRSSDPRGICAATDAVSGCQLVDPGRRVLEEVRVRHGIVSQMNGGIQTGPLLLLLLLLIVVIAGQIRSERAGRGAGRGGGCCSAGHGGGGGGAARSGTRRACACSICSHLRVMDWCACCVRAWTASAQSTLEQWRKASREHSGRRVCVCSSLLLPPFLHPSTRCPVR